MKANRLLLRVLSSAVIVTAAILLPAPVAGVVRAEEAVTAKAPQDVGATSETVQEQSKGAQEVAKDVQDAAENAGQNIDSSEEQITEQEQAAREAEAARKALQNDPSHIHRFKWIAIMNESESAEGTINYMCPECGKIWYFRPISAYYAFQGDVARRIETAPENATVSVKTSLFINFNRQVMEALAERPDVSLYVSFLDQEYKGNRVSFVIPAGEDTMSLLDENGYAGFLFLGGKYGLTVEEPVVVSDTATETTDTATETTETATETIETATVTDSTSIEN